MTQNVSWSPRMKAEMSLPLTPSPQHFIFKKAEYHSTELVGNISFPCEGADSAAEPNITFSMRSITHGLLLNGIAFLLCMQGEPGAELVTALEWLNAEEWMSSKAELALPPPSRSPFSFPFFSLLFLVFQAQCQQRRRGTGSAWTVEVPWCARDWGSECC